jgi:hypothetical protein
MLTTIKKSTLGIGPVAFSKYSNMISIKDESFNFSKNEKLLPDSIKKYHSIISQCDVSENNKCYLTVYEGPIYRKESDHNSSYDYQRKNPKYFTYADIHDTFLASTLTTNYLIGSETCDIQDAHDITKILKQNDYFKEDFKIDRNYYLSNNADFQKLYNSSNNIQSENNNILVTQIEKNTLYKIPKYTPYKMTRVNDTTICQQFKLVVL